MNQQTPTDVVILDTLVHLVRQVPWGPNRDVLEKEARKFQAEAVREDEARQKDGRFDLLHAGKYEEYRAACDAARVSEVNSYGLRWKAYLYNLAAQGRFSRPDDNFIKVAAGQIIDQIRVLKSGSCNTYPPIADYMLGESEVRKAILLSVQNNGLDLMALQIPPTLRELIERGAEKPDDVDQDRWNKSISSYYHSMDIENSPGVDPEEYETDYDYSFEWTAEHEETIREWAGVPEPENDECDTEVAASCRM